MNVRNLSTRDPDPVVVYDLQPFVYRDVRELSASEQRDTHPHDLARQQHDTLQNTLQMLPEVHWRIKPSVDIEVVFDHDVLHVTMNARGFIRQRSDGSTWFLP